MPSFGEIVADGPCVAAPADHAGMATAAAATMPSARIDRSIRRFARIGDVRMRTGPKACQCEMGCDGERSSIRPGGFTFRSSGLLTLAPQAR